VDVTPAAAQPAVASIYQLDSLVRRAPSLQLTADAKHPDGDAKHPSGDARTTAQLQGGL